MSFRAILTWILCSALESTATGQSKPPDFAHDPFQKLYQSTALDHPQQDCISDDDVAGALITLADAQRLGLLSGITIDAHSLITGVAWVGKKFQNNRIGKMRESGSPAYKKTFKAAIDLAACFPSQFPETDQSQVSIWTLRLLAQDGFETPEIRAAALDALRLIGTSQAFRELSRALDSLQFEIPGTDSALRRRKILTTLAEMNPSAAAPYVWRELPRLPDAEATIAWRFILSQSDSILPLLNSMPANLPTNEAERAFAAALATGQKAESLVDRLRRVITESK